MMLATGNGIALDVGVAQLSTLLSVHSGVGLDPMVGGEA